MLHVLVEGSRAAYRNSARGGGGIWIWTKEGAKEVLGGG